MKRPNCTCIDGFFVMPNAHAFINQTDDGKARIMVRDAYT